MASCRTSPSAFVLILFLSSRLEVIVAGSCSSELLPSNRIHLSYLKRVRALSFFFEPNQVRLSELLSVLVNRVFFFFYIQSNSFGSFRIKFSLFILIRLKSNQSELIVVSFRLSKLLLSNLITLIWFISNEFMCIHSHWNQTMPTGVNIRQFFLNLKVLLSIIQFIWDISNAFTFDRSYSNHIKLV